jgi:nitrate/TMAO reductase-like tetraheme cytochrome c subunit
MSSGPVTPPNDESKLARLIPRNIFGQAGVTLAVVSVGNIIVFTVIDMISGKPNPYIGILAYMVAPAFLVFSLALIGFGYWRDRKHEYAGTPPYPRIDLNDPSQRSAFLGLMTFFGVFVLVSAAGSYKAYEFTDSVQFCGLTCHGVMHPEYTAYQQSSHARVACVECHVGAGATWYVKSKMSGLRQVFATAFDTYPRPIPTPVHNLRPAQETCEACHWPKKFYGAQLKVFTHFSSDEKNTPHQIQMLIRTGGGDPATGEPEGIHWHMNIGVHVQYVAADEQRQIIPYVRVEDLQGRVTEYYAKDSTMTREQIAKAPRHKMDCIDCHDRPSHVYTPPDQSVDQALLSHRIDSILPYIKQQAVAALTASYKTTPQAVQGIATSIQDYYEKSYPNLAKSHELEIRNAITEVQAIYQRTIFPEMKVDWRTHPNNIGHLYFSGCFRCHDGQHVSADGKVVPKDCNTCHTVFSQQDGTLSSSMAAPVKAIFQHPVDIGDLTQVTCTDCHTGGAGP